MEGKLMGCLEEGESIILKIIEFDNLWKMCNDMKTLSALFLYEKYKQGKLNIWAN